MTLAKERVIREALSKLEQGCHVNVIPHRRYFVSDVSDADVEQLYEIRQALESLAIRTAIRKGTREDWQRLNDVLHRNQSEPNREGVKRKRFDVGRHFHIEIARISGSSHLRKMLDSIFDKLDRLRWIDIFFLDREILSH